MSIRALSLAAVVVLWLTGCSYRTDATVLWTQSYGGAARDVGGSIADAPGGGWLVVGSTRSFGDGTDAIWLLRLDAHGDTIWTRSLGAPPGMRTATMSIASAPDGWVVGGQRHVAGNNRDIVIIAVDSIGHERWSRTYGGDGYDHFEVIRRTSDGGYIVGGGYTSPGDDHDRPWVLRLDGMGDTIWTRVFPGPGFGHADAITESPNGGFVVAFGTGERPDEDPSRIEVVELDEHGRTLWTWAYGGPEIHVWPEWIEALPDGGYIIAGPACEPCSPRQPNYQTNFDALAVRLTQNGDTVWTRRLGHDAGNDLAYFVTLTSRGTYMIGGAASPPGGPVDSPWLVELDSAGRTIWSHVFESPFPRNGVAQVREVAPDEFLVVGPPWLYQRDGAQDLWVLRLRK